MRLVLAALADLMIGGTMLSCASIEGLEGLHEVECRGDCDGGSSGGSGGDSSVADSSQSADATGAACDPVTCANGCCEKGVCPNGFPQCTLDAGYSLDSGGSADAKAPTTIAFVQGAEMASHNPESSLSVAYPNPQEQGDLNVVAVGWGSAGEAVSVADSKGNTYALAVGPPTGGGLGLSLYYAPHIASAASNTVTVTFSPSAAYPTVVILEYSGVNLVDQTRGSTGSSVAASSGAVTTTVSKELVVGAGYPGAADFVDAGAGFTERFITSTNHMLAEDRVVSTTGMYSATGTMSASAAWVMQVATFE